MAETAAAPLLHTPTGGPESLFRLGPIGVDDAGRGRMAMPTGPWLAGPDGRAGPGAVAVLVDDVLGQSAIAFRPAGHFPVTTEMTVEATGPLPLTGEELVAESEVLRRDGDAVLARATVHGPGGWVAAAATTAEFVTAAGRTVAARTSAARAAAVSPVRARAAVRSCAARPGIAGGSGTPARVHGGWWWPRWRVRTVDRPGSGPSVCWPLLSAEVGR